MEITLKFDKDKKFSSEGIGIAIILKYQLDAEFYCEHDEIWVGSYRNTYSKMTEEEKKIMRESGWSDDDNSWYTFV